MIFGVEEAIFKYEMEALFKYFIRSHEVGVTKQLKKTITQNNGRV